MLVKGEVEGSYINVSGTSGHISKGGEVRDEWIILFTGPRGSSDEW